jgi:hypothetical protein
VGGAAQATHDRRLVWVSDQTRTPIGRYDHAGLDRDRAAYVTVAE